MNINKKSPIPVYYQLKNLILEKIKKGEYASGELIPSERELSESLGISRMTVRQALSQLVTEGHLYREKGRGTFVTARKIEQNNIRSFSDLVRERGMQPSTHILSFTKETGLFDIAKELGLPADETMYYIKRLRRADHMPIAIEEAFIPEKFCPGLDTYDLTQSLYRVLEQNYGYKILYVDNSIESTRPDKEQKSLLELPSDVHILKIQGVSYSGEGMPLLYERNVYRADKYAYTVRIHLYNS